MYIGTKGLNRLASLNVSVEKFKNLIFDIEQAIISDKNARLIGDFDKLKPVVFAGTPLQPKLQGVPTRLNEIIDHPVLFNVYPELADLPVVRLADLPSDGPWVKETNGAGAAYVSGNGCNNFVVFEEAQKLTSHGHKIIEVLLHEIQHSIQDIEEYFVGALIAPDGNADETKALYYAHPQEREAFNVEAMFLGSKKIWFAVENPDLINAGYPKRLNWKSWNSQTQKFLTFYLRRDLQRMCSSRAMELKICALQ